MAPGEDFYAEKGSVIYLEAGIEKELSFNGSGLGRILGAKLSGESLFILRLFNVSNMPRKVVIGSRFGLLPVKINGETIICHRGVYVGSNNKVSVTTKLSIAGLTGGMGLLLQKIQGSSTVFLDTKGTPITINLQYGETIEVDGKTYPLVKLEITSSSHPFFTGKQKLVDTAGRVDKFMSRYGNRNKK